ncbi:MAG TPA: hypothetical protein VF139_02335 [Candidatus Polarisedimenticolaceae bacterium]
MLRAACLALVLLVPIAALAGDDRPVERADLPVASREARPPWGLLVGTGTAATLVVGGLAMLWARRLERVGRV